MIGLPTGKSINALQLDSIWQSLTGLIEEVTERFVSFIEQETFYDGVH